MRLSHLMQIWKIHFSVAFFVGLVLGTAIGLYEGISTIISQGVMGRYNELVAWAILFDAAAMIAVEFGLALISGLIFSGADWVPVPRDLVSLQLGETAFVIVLARALWTRGLDNPSLFVQALPGIVLPAAAAGLALGQVILMLSMWVTAHTPLLRQLRGRYWLIFEAVVVLMAIAFGFSHWAF